MTEDKFKRLNEPEREALEADLEARFGAPARDKRGFGVSMYAPSSSVFFTGSREPGTRGKVVPVCKSWWSRGYKGRGRWTFVSIFMADPAGDLALCSPDDRGAQEINMTTAHARPWAIHEEIEKTGGLGLAGAEILANVLELAGIKKEEAK